MGTIRKGTLGGFYVKAESIVGSSCRDISYIKGLSKLSNKPKEPSIKSQDFNQRTICLMVGLVILEYSESLECYR